MTTVYNEKGHKLFEARYDEHHRAIEQRIGESFVSFQFNLHHRTAFSAGSNSYSSQQQFDSLYGSKLIQDTLGREIKLAYGQEDGPQKVTTSAGFEIDYAYDEQGNLSKISDPFQGERKFAYNDRGQVTFERDGEEIEKAYQYDDKGRLILKYSPFFVASIGIMNEEPYIQGNTAYLTSFDYDQETGLLSRIIFPGGQTETYRYNEMGLPTEIIHANGLKALKEYDERARMKNLESGGRNTSYCYDQRGRVTKIISQKEEIRFSYDTAGNLSSLTDPENRTTEHDYDYLEKLVQTIDPNKEITFYEYGSCALSRIRLPNGSTREFFYDDYNRPIAIR